MRNVKSLYLLMIVVLLTGCEDEKPPIITIPSYLSPEGKEVLNDAYDELQECQSIQAMAMFGEIINLSDPVSYAAGQIGQSAGSNQVSLPVTDNVSILTNINEICCHDISKKVDKYIVSRFIIGKPFTYQQNNFWRHLSRNMGTQGQCIPPKKPPKFLPGGRRYS